MLRVRQPRRAVHHQGSGWKDDAPNPAASNVAPFRLYNLGNAQRVPLTRYIEVLEKHLGKRANKKLLPMQPGDVTDTFADISASTRDLGYVPKTGVDDGVKKFVDWYRGYYGA